MPNRNPMKIDEKERVLRIVDEATHKIPKRIYPDDALFLVDLVRRYHEALVSLAESGSEKAYEVIDSE